MRPLPAPGPFTVAIAFALGVACAPKLDRAEVPGSARWVLAAALGLVATRRQRLILPAIATAGVAYGALGTVERTGTDDRIVDRIEGEVTGPVVTTARGHGALLAGTATWVWSTEPLIAGERIEVTGYLASPVGPRGPGLVDPLDAVRARGAERQISARSIRRLADDPDTWARLWRWAGSVQRSWATAIEEAGGDANGRAALRGIAVGDRTTIPTELDERWRAVGIYHVLSVSGLHLAVVAGLLYALLRRVLAGSPVGGRIHPARWAAPVAFALAIAYTMITGAQLATLRALIVVGVMFTGAMLDRPARLLDALSVAALVILIWRPGDLFDPGFQLSFAAALVLAVRQGVVRRPGIAGWLGHQLATSAWVSLVTAPITAFHFHQVTAGGVVGNLILTPVVELVALPLALAGLALDLELPILISSTLIGVVDDVARPLATMSPVGTVALASSLLMAALVALSIALAARRVPRRIGWLALCLAWSLGRVPAPDEALRVTFVDVGQGDAAIVELPDGTVILIDAGGHANARDPVVGARPGRTIARVLAAYGRDHVDIAIISHPHPDHYLGLAGLGLPIGELWFAPEDIESSAFQSLVDQLATRGTRIVHPRLDLVWQRAGVELVALGPRHQPAPDAPVVLAADPVRSVNDNSLVISLRFAGRTLLFTGDVEAEGEDQLVTAGLARVDILKVAHHGSPTSSSAHFIAAAHPALAVISCGRGNPFGFPAPAILARLRAVGAEIARTDTEGTIAVTVAADGGITVERFATPPL